MKNLNTFLCLVLTCSAMAQPLQHNRFTTNIDGAGIDGSPVTNLGGINFAGEPANSTIIGQGAGSNPMFTTNGNVIFNTLNAQSLGGTPLNGANITGVIPQSVASNSGAVTYPSLNPNQLNTNGGKVALTSGVTLTNPAITGYVTNVVLSNATIMQSSIYPSNVYTASVTLTATNNKTFVKLSAAPSITLQAGDNIVVCALGGSVTNNQYMVTQYSNSTQTLGIYPVWASGNQTGGSNFIVYPNGLYFKDINGAYQGGVGNDGSVVVTSGPNFNSGRLGLVSQDGASSAFFTLNNTDSLGPAMNLNANADQLRGGVMKVYLGFNNGPINDTLDLCPCPFYFGAVAVRSLTNLQGSTIPFWLPAQLPSFTSLTGTVSNGLTVSNLTSLTATISNNFLGNSVFAMALTSSNAATIATNNAAVANLSNPLVDMVTPFVNGNYRATLSVTVALTDSAVSGSPGALLTNTSSTQGIPMTNSFVLSGTSYQTVFMRLSPNDQVYVTNLSSGSASATLIRSFLTKE